MRHALLLAAVLMFSGLPSASAAEAGERQTWIVGTTGAPSRAAAERHRSRPVRMFRSIDAYAVEMTAEEAEALRGQPGVRWVEPEYVATMFGPRTVKTPLRGSAPAVSASLEAITTAQSTPWGVDRIRAEELWSHTRGRTVRVGVADTGIDFTNIDFRAATEGRSRLMRRPPNGFDFVNDDANPADDEGHGTHVAGTIAAADNAFGVIGVAPDVELYALKVLGSNGKGTSTNLVRAIDWAIEHDLDVLNFSLGFDQSPFAVEEAVERAIGAGIVVVAASGNGFDDGAVGISYPAAYPGVISVGAIAEDESIAGFSQRGTGLDVVAPGVGVFSTVRVGSGVAAEVARSSGQPLDAMALVGSPAGTLTGQYVYCGLGKPEEFPASVSGKIALIARGELTFNEKVRNAKAAGAVAAVIFNHSDGPSFTGTLLREGNAEDETFPWLLTVGISQADGEMLRNSASGELQVRVVPFDWGHAQGTSMASPHVAGVAALLRAMVPGATPAQVEMAITAGARDAGAAGWDGTFGYGIVDAWGAAHALAPERVPATP